MKILPVVAAMSMLAITATANESVTLRYATFLPTEYGECPNPDEKCENPNVDGMAMIRYNAGPNMSRVQIMLSGLKPHMTYGVQVGQALWEPAAIVTNSQGRGNFAGDFLGPPFPDNPTILIFIHDGGPDYAPRPDEKRAFSIPM